MPYRLRAFITFSETNLKWISAISTEVVNVNLVKQT